MDAETREYLEGMEARINERLDRQDEMLDKIQKQTDGTDARLGALEYRIDLLERA